MKKIKRWLAACTAVALIAVGAAVAVPLSASAHTGDMDVSAVCNTQTGQYDLTVKLTIAQTALNGSTKWKVGNENFTGTPGSDAGLDRGPVTSNGAGVITLGTFSLPGTTTGLGPWVYSYSKWSDGYGYGSDDQLRNNERLKGDCKKPFDWNWKYADPTCTALTVVYPSDIPNGQANDVNVKIKNLATNVETTINFHKNQGTWSGTQVFTYASKITLPPHYAVTWVQVAGTNYHWQGNIECGSKPNSPEPLSGTDSGQTEPVCVIPLNNTKTYSTWTQAWTQGWVWNAAAYKWELGTKVYADKVFTPHFIPTGDEECDPPLIEVSVTFPEPTPPGCTTDGSLPQTPADTEFVTWAWSGSTLTATAKKDYVIVGEKSRVYDVPGTATGYQIEDPEAPCYVEPLTKEDTEEESKSAAVCGDETVDVFTTVTSYTFDFFPETGTFSAPIPHVGEPVKTGERAVTNEELSELECPLVPGDIAAQCVSDVPYLNYDLDLPAGWVGEEEATITFSDASHSYTLPGTHPLSGSVLWPGASDGAVKSWPGWVTNSDGSYTATADPAYFGWTREGVTVTFQVNPEYSTTVAYPAATSLCADPPAKVYPPGLAYSGVDNPIIIGLSAALLALLGVIAVAATAHRRRRREDEMVALNDRLNSI